MVTAGCTISGDGNSNEDRLIGESSGDSELGEDGGSGEELDTSIGKSGRDNCCGRSSEPSVSLQSKNRCYQGN